MSRFSFHKLAMSFLFLMKQKTAPLMLPIMLVFAFAVPPAHGSSFSKDGDGELWARVCTPLKVYDVNIVTGEIRYPSDEERNENSPQEVPVNACHNACARREDALNV